MKTFLSALFCALLFFCVGCSQDNTFNGEKLNATQVKTPYEKALQKLSRINQSMGKSGTRSSDDIVGVIPLCYGDTGAISPPIYVDPWEWEVPANDSIYAYVFDYSNNQGYMVVTTNDNLPDLLMFSYEGNFMQSPGNRPPSNGNESLEDYLQWYQQELTQLLAHFANQANKVIFDAQQYGLEFGDGGSGYTPPRVDTCLKVGNPVTEYLYGGHLGASPTDWYCGTPYIDQIIERNGSNVKCWSMLSTVANYLATR